MSVCRLEKQRFDELNAFWRDDFKSIFNAGNYSCLWLSPKHTKSNQIYVTTPLVRRMVANRMEHSGTLQNGIIQSNNQISTVVQVICNNNLEGDSFRVGLKSYDEFKQTLIVRTGRDVLNNANIKSVNFCSLEQKINDLGQKLSQDIKTESGRCDFLKRYLDLCCEFSNEINYNTYLEKISILNPFRI
jgi:hypothetical protein